MVKNQYYIIAGFILFTGIIAYFILIQSEETKIKKRFYFIAEKIEKTPGENQIISVANANRLKDVIVDKCTILAPSYGISRNISPEDLSRFVLARRMRFSEISLQFYDFIIDFPEENAAIVGLTESMDGTLKTGESVEDTHELKCRLQKTDGVWRFKEIEIVEVLRK